MATVGSVVGTEENGLLLAPVGPDEGAVVTLAPACAPALYSRQNILLGLVIRKQSSLGPRSKHI